MIFETVDTKGEFISLKKSVKSVLVIYKMVLYFYNRQNSHPSICLFRKK
jgi:hypothetical protein